ncbi:lysosomal Pro-X carboxypeptidase-like [Amphiura filiformis]|uniref:lysosomal Pro-X carboxypeptidase-like n=1 Tax=Amphiura filiformis TaxID=82378 RepID=UPI003B213A3D
MEIPFRIFLVFTLCGGASAVLFGHRAHNPGVEEQSKSYEYNTSYYNVLVDHFGFANSDTYAMRYLTSVTHWDHNGGPIFFYTGNEGDIAWFCNNTGFMWDIAPEFQAMLVFAEHRYYGESLPYGTDSYKDKQHLDFFTAEQALADFADLIRYIKSTVPGASNSAVIAFGGSYGGMLAAWLRMKYPSSVIGSLAASAPIWQFTGLTGCETQVQIVTKDFRKASPACAKNIRRSWDVMTKFGKTASGRQTLFTNLRLCDPLKTSSDVEGIKSWLSEVYDNLAMVDYPYAASFLEPLPAYPIKVVCSYINKTEPSDDQLLLDLANGLNVYFNYTGSAKCFNASQAATGDLSDEGWGYQSCTEMVMPYCSDGVQDMFPVVKWDEAKEAAQCQKTWQVTPRPQWINLQFGGKDIQAASNIIFSNGQLDPWSAGGVLESLSDTLIAIIIPEGAHHLDLRAKNYDDPPSVTKARETEKTIMRQWIKSYYIDNKTNFMNNKNVKL